MRDLAYELGTLRQRPTPAATSGVPFDVWLTTFRKGAAGRDALRALADVERYGPLGASFPALVIAVMRSCYFASQFKPGDDPGTRYRARIRAEREALPAIRDAAARLRKLLEANPSVALWGNWGSGSRARIVDTIAAFERRISGDLPELHGGPWLYRFTFGCLHYTSPREGRRARAPDVAGALLVDLVAHFRDWTCTGHPPVRGSGHPLPTTGRPCYRVAALLATAALGVGSITERAARTRVEALAASGVTLIRWPNNVTRSVFDP